MLIAAAQPTGPIDPTKVIVWSLVLMAILILAFVAVAKVKRRFKDEVDTNPTASSGFTLADLRRMHRDGLLTDDELEKAKAKIVQAAKRTAGRETTVSPSIIAEDESPPIDLPDPEP